MHPDTLRSFLSRKAKLGIVFFTYFFCVISSFVRSKEAQGFLSIRLMGPPAATSPKTFFFSLAPFPTISPLPLSVSLDFSPLSFSQIGNEKNISFPRAPLHIEERKASYNYIRFWQSSFFSSVDSSGNEGQGHFQIHLFGLPPHRIPQTFLWKQLHVSSDHGHPSLVFFLSCLSFFFFFLFPLSSWACLDIPLFLPFLSPHGLSFVHSIPSPLACHAHRHCLTGVLFRRVRCAHGCRNAHHYATSPLSFSLILSLSPCE